MKNAKNHLLLIVAGVLLISTIAATPGHAARLFVLVDTGELFVSNDQGATWTVQASLPVHDAQALMASTTSQILFLAARSGTVYRSLNGGDIWSAVGTVPSGSIVDLAVRPDAALLALTEGGTIWISLDEGATFDAFSTVTAPNSVSLTVGPTGYIYLLTRTGEIAESVDGGAGWVTKGLISIPDAIRIRRLDKDLYVLSETGLTYKSTDGGTTWLAVGSVSQVGMAGLTQAVNKLVAVTSEGLVARSGDGSSWEWIGAVNQLRVTALANDTPNAIGVPEDPGHKPEFLHSSLWPNPLRSSGRAVSLDISLPDADTVRLDIFDLSGRRIRRRAPERFEAGGKHTLRWHLGELEAGIYFLRIVTEKGFNAGQKLSVIR